MPEHFSVAVEGALDGLVARRLITHCGHHVAAVYDARGKHNLDQKLVGYNAAAEYGWWLVFRDLDNDAPCGPALCEDLLPTRANKMVLRVILHALEAWVLADGKAAQGFFGFRKTVDDPESIIDPKTTLLDLARNSRKKDVRKYLPPPSGSGVRVGPAYSSLLSEFLSLHWDPDRAAQSADSLARCMGRLRSIR